MKLSARFAIRLLLPLIAALMALLFVFSIHPASGFLGGMFFVFFGSAIPSVINLLLSAWVALFFRFRTGIRAILFVVTSFVLGINTYLPQLLKPPPTPPATMSIGHPVFVTPSTPIDIGLMVATPHNPLENSKGPDPLGVFLNIDEGCGCMYFVYGDYDEDYYWDFEHRMENLGYFDNEKQHFDVFDPIKSPNVLHLDINFTRGASTNSVNVIINVYDGLKKSATYVQHDLPVVHPDPKSIGRERPLLSPHFMDYCVSILMHRNFWTALFRHRISGNPIAPFDNFLSRALPRSI